VIERILRAREVYDGPYTERAPDLVFFTRDMSYKAMGLSDFSSPHVFDSVYGTTGHHRMNGLLICRGPGVIKEGEWLEGARIEDLAPTILYAMGQPIPSEMDGRVLSDLFTGEFRQRQAVRYQQGGESVGKEAESVYSQQDQAELMETLRGLGYVT
jgi:predicted AlkP superfamily phosphohydrolase/phosphomutase